MEASASQNGRIVACLAGANQHGAPLLSAVRTSDGTAWTAVRAGHAMVQVLLGGTLHLVMRFPEDVLHLELGQLAALPHNPGSAALVVVSAAFRCWLLRLHPGSAVSAPAHGKRAFLSSNHADWTAKRPVRDHQDVSMGTSCSSPVVGWATDGACTPTLHQGPATPLPGMSEAPPAAPVIRVGGQGAVMLLPPAPMLLGPAAAAALAAQVVWEHIAIGPGSLLHAAQPMRDPIGPLQHDQQPERWSAVPLSQVGGAQRSGASAGAGLCTVRDWVAQWRQPLSCCCFLSPAPAAASSAPPPAAPSAPGASNPASAPASVCSSRGVISRTLHAAVGGSNAAGTLLIGTPTGQVWACPLHALAPTAQASADHAAGTESTTAAAAAHSKEKAAVVVAVPAGAGAAPHPQACLLADLQQPVVALLPFCRRQDGVADALLLLGSAGRVACVTAEAAALEPGAPEADAQALPRLSLKVWQVPGPVRCACLAGHLLCWTTGSQMYAANIMSQPASGSPPCFASELIAVKAGLQHLAAQLVSPVPSAEGTPGQLLLLCTQGMVVTLPVSALQALDAQPSSASVQDMGNEIAALIGSIGQLSGCAQEVAGSIRAVEQRLAEAGVAVALARELRLRHALDCRLLPAPPAAYTLLGLPTSAIPMSLEVTNRSDYPVSGQWSVVAVVSGEEAGGPWAQVSCPLGPLQPGGAWCRTLLPVLPPHLALHGAVYLCYHPPGQEQAGVVLVNEMQFSLVHLMQPLPQQAQQQAAVVASLPHSISLRLCLPAQHGSPAPTPNQLLRRLLHPAGAGPLPQPAAAVQPSMATASQVGMARLPGEEAMLSIAAVALPPGPHETSHTYQVTLKSSSVVVLAASHDSIVSQAAAPAAAAEQPPAGARARGAAEGTQQPSRPGLVASAGQAQVEAALQELRRLQRQVLAARDAGEALWRLRAAASTGPAAGRAAAFPVLVNQAQTLRQGLLATYLQLRAATSMLPHQTAV